MSTEHTPGPWTILPCLAPTAGAIIQHSDGERVSHVARLYASALCPEHGTVEANARLIACLPRLLLALKAILAEVDDRYDGAPKEPGGSGNVWVQMPIDIFEDARDAITQAEGEV